MNFELEELRTRLDELEKRVARLEKKKPTKVVGKPVWEAYSQAFFDRYGMDPIRNAMVNGQAINLIKRLGEKNAIEVVRFYLKQNNSFYVQKLHPLGLCLQDSEPLWTRLKTGIQMTTTKARQIEQTGAGLDASSKYLRRKHNAK